MPTILLVEDDDLTRDLLATVLSRMGGFEVRATDDSDEIVNLVRDGKVHLVLMDVSLTKSWLDEEEMNGVALTRMLKSNPATRAVPVALISAFAMTSEAEAMLKESSADDYIAKPVTDFDAFVAKINELLRKASDASSRPSFD